MKVLIVNTNREKTPFPVLPVGACLVASAAADLGRHDVRLLDLNFSSDPRGETERALSEFKPDVTGLSIRNIDNVDSVAPVLYLEGIRKDVADPLRERRGGAIVAGGPGFSIEPAGIMGMMGADFGVVGDGELAFAGLLKALESGSGFESVPGLVWKDSAGAIRTNPRAHPPGLDELPRSRPWRWLDLSRYRSYGASFGVQTKRGCMLSCAYCVYNSIEGKSYRVRSAASIGEELDECARESPFRDVEFTDSTFNAPLDHAKEVCAEISRRSRRFRFHTSGINPGFVDAELAGLLARAGFRSVMITAESASDPALEGLRKGFTSADVRKTLDLVKPLGIKVFWFFLLGGPGETRETVEETLKFIGEEIPRDHVVYIGIGIRIQSGSPLERIARDEGVIGPDEPLLAPRFYFSPPTDSKWLRERVDREVLAHANYVQAIDYQGGKGPVILARLFSFLRLRNPSWSFVPTLYRLIPFARKKDRSGGRGQ